MIAKNAQIHSGEHRSGYARRFLWFLLDPIKSIWRKLLHRPVNFVQPPLIYLRGDESSHFRERGTKYERWHVYPA